MCLRVRDIGRRARRGGGSRSVAGVDSWVGAIEENGGEAAVMLAGSGFRCWIPLKEVVANRNWTAQMGRCHKSRLGLVVGKYIPARHIQRLEKNEQKTGRACEENEPGGTEKASSIDDIA